MEIIDRKPNVQEAGSWQVVWSEIRPFLTVRNIIGGVGILLDVAVIVWLIVQ